MNLPKIFEALQRVPASSPFHGSPHLRQLAHELGPRRRGLFGSTWGTLGAGERLYKVRQDNDRVDGNLRPAVGRAAHQPHRSRIHLPSSCSAVYMARASFVACFREARVRQPVSVGVSLVFAFLPVHLSPGWKNIIIIIELLDEFIVRKTILGSSGSCSQLLPLLETRRFS